MRAAVMGLKKRRKPTLTLFSFLCSSCGLIFVFGNILMLHDGFSELFHSTFGSTGNTISNQKVPLPGVQGVVDRSLVGMRSIDLPVSALAIETRLRHLLQDNINEVDNTAVPATRKQYRVRNVIPVPHADLKNSLSYSSNCPDILNISNKEYIASGWTKAVYRAKLGGKDVAIKVVDTTALDFSNCKDQAKDTVLCYNGASQKILKEILLLQGFKHNNIIQMLKHCVPAQEYTGEPENQVAMVTELGQTIDIIKLLQMSWEDRLRISQGVTRLLDYLAHSPFGSAVMHDFRRQQFVLVDGELKLTDVDDMGFEEPGCLKHTDCTQYFSSANFTLRTKCVDGLCQGFNEKKNIFNAARHFTSFLLPHGAPRSLRPYINTLLDGYGNATMSSKELVRRLDEVVNMYVNGQYLNRPRNQHTEYHELRGTDLPGLFDYRCQYSIASSGCTVSVFDQQEAELLCNNDRLCKGFVLSSQKTWTGRVFAHLKNNMTVPSRNKDTNLYIRPL